MELWAMLAQAGPGIGAGITAGDVVDGLLNLTGMGLVAFVLRHVFVVELPAQREIATAERERWFAALQGVQDTFSSALDKMHEVHRAEREADRAARHRMASDMTGPLMELSKSIQEAIAELRRK